MMDLFPIAGLTAGRLAVALRPRGADWLDDQLASLAARGWLVLVSALEHAEIRELELTAAPDLCRAHGIELLHHPLPDRSVPSMAAAQRLATDLARRLAAGASIALHCRQGIGRSSTLAAATLVRSGESPERAWDRVERARGRPVPDTPEQRAWLTSFASTVQR